MLLDPCEARVFQIRAELFQILIGQHTSCSRQTAALCEPAVLDMIFTVHMAHRTPQKNVDVFHGAVYCLS